MKAQLENLLSCYPRCYAKLLRLKGGTSPEKLAYLALLKDDATLSTNVIFANRKKHQARLQHL